MTRANPPATFQQALSAGKKKMQRKDYDAAIPLLEEALRLNPRRAETKRLLLIARFEQQYQEGCRLLSDGELRRAQESLNRALKLASSPGMEDRARLVNVRMAIVEGVKLMQSRSYEAAAKRYQLALALSPGDNAALAGLTEARYRAAYRSGLAALARGSLDQARDRFQECLEYKPGATEARKQLDSILQTENEIAQFQRSFQEAESFLDSKAWGRADGEIKRLVSIMQEVEQMGIHPKEVFASRPLLPAYVSYAFGDLNGAIRLGESAIGKTNAVRAANFCEFVRSERRSHYLRTWTPAFCGGYLFVLLLSLYAGLKKSLLTNQPETISGTSGAVSAFE